MTDLPPGRQAYITARHVLRRKRATCVPERMAVVLQFPNKKEVTDGPQEAGCVCGSICPLCRR